MVGYNFGPVPIDFSPLGKLGETYDRSVKRTREAEIAQKREAALAGFGQNGDLAALGQTLLRAGDLEGGMSALRLQAANEGTPWQKQRAAAEDARAAEADAYRRQEEEANRRYEEGKTRADRPTRITEDDTDPVTGMPTKREGMLFPDGTVKWRAPGAPDTFTPPGPQSGGPGDPNLPPVGGTLAQLTTSGNPNTPVTDTGQPEYGYAIPGTGQRFPHGTILPPKGDTATAVQAPPMPPVRPPDAANLPTVGAQQNQAPPVAAPVAAPAGQTAVAAAPQGQPAIQRRATRDAPLEPDTAPFVRWPPPFVNAKEWVAAETKRLATLASGGGEATAAMKGKLADARQRVVPIFKALDALEADVKEFGSQLVPGEEKARMNVAATNIIMQLKDLYQLGALQKGDLEQIEKMISNPTADNPIEWGVKAIRHGLGTTTGEVKAVKKLVLERMLEAEKHLGGDPTRVPEGVNATTRQVERYDRDGNLVK